MNVVILCGGRGLRLNEKTVEKPKPLIKIGKEPILSHIMKIYSHYGFNNFILCLGYKGKLIEEYFKKNNNKGWDIKFVDTGEESSKGQRIKRVEEYIKDENFFVAYGDDVADVNIKKILDHHLTKGKIATITTVNPKSQFGIIEINNNNEVIGFKERPKLDHWINGGFFVFNKKIFSYIKDNYDLEEETFEELVKKKEICCYKHYGFWKCMNTFKDFAELDELFNRNKAPWKVWK